MKKTFIEWRKATQEELDKGSPEMIKENEFEYDYEFYMEVSSWKIKAVLSQLNLLENVLTALNGLPEPNKTTGLLAWEFSPTIRSNSPTARFVQVALGLSDEQVMEIFINANSIDV